MRAPLTTLTSELPPGPAPTMTSSWPSPLTSPAATVTPPVNVGAKAKKSRPPIRAPKLIWFAALTLRLPLTRRSAPLTTSTSGPPPGPAPRMRSRGALGVSGLATTKGC